MHKKLPMVYIITACYSIAHAEHGGVDPLDLLMAGFNINLAGLMCIFCEYTVPRWMTYLRCVNCMVTYKAIHYSVSVFCYEDC